MIITGIRGTELEGLFKQYYEQMVAEQKTLFLMIKEFSGIDPVDIDYLDRSPIWIKKGYSCLWDYDYIRFPEDSQPLNMVSIKDKGGIYYKPNRSLESSKKFMRQWHRLFKGLNGNILVKFGIPIVMSFVCYPWKPICHNGKYGIEVHDDIKQYLSNIKGKQYEIEENVR